MSVRKVIVIASIHPPVELADVAKIFTFILPFIRRAATDSPATARHPQTANTRPSPYRSPSSMTLTLNVAAGIEHRTENPLSVKSELILVCLLGFIYMSTVHQFIPFLIITNLCLANDPTI